MRIRIKDLQARGVAVEVRDSEGVRLDLNVNDSIDLFGTHEWTPKAIKAFETVKEELNLTDTDCEEVARLLESKQILRALRDASIQ